MHCGCHVMHENTADVSISPVCTLQRNMVVTWAMTLIVRLQVLVWFHTNQFANIGLYTPSKLTLFFKKSFYCTTVVAYQIGECDANKSQYLFKSWTHLYCGFTHLKIGGMLDVPSRRGGAREADAHRPTSEEWQCRVENMFRTIKAGPRLFSSNTHCGHECDDRHRACPCQVSIFFTERNQVNASGIAVYMLNSLIRSKYLWKRWLLWKECLTLQICRLKERKKKRKKERKGGGKEAAPSRSSPWFAHKKSNHVWDGKKNNEESIHNIQSTPSWCLKRVMSTFLLHVNIYFSHAHKCI